MTNDFDVSPPTFMKQNNPGGGLPESTKQQYKWPQVNSQSKHVDEKHPLQFQNQEPQTSINNLNQNSQILYATKKRQRATDELQETKSTKLPK